MPRRAENLGIRAQRAFKLPGIKVFRDHLHLRRVNPVLLEVCQDPQRWVKK
jgi:hypothetical protein